MSECTERWVVGDTVLTAIVESEAVGVPVGMFYPDATGADVARATGLVDGVATDDGTIAFRVQSFVLQHQGKLVVVDPCVGNGKRRTMPFWNDLELPWLERFISAGFDPSDVDLVIHTHLHEDHIGWDTRMLDGVWVPTFANARHVYVGEELEWAARDDRRLGHDPFADSIAPILDAGLGWEVSADDSVGDGIQLLSTPGHTPGHTSVRLETSAEPLMITGDVLHHPFQLAAPEIAEIGDCDREQARLTRTGYFDECARSGVLQAGTHFPVAPVGRFEPTGQHWRFVPEAGLVVD